MDGDNELSAVNSDPIDCRPDSSDLDYAKKNGAVSLNIDRDFAVAVILSGGIAISMALFVVLGVIYPTRIDPSVIALLAPAGAAIVNAIRCKDCKSKRK